MDTQTTANLEKELFIASISDHSSRVLELCQMGVNPDGFTNWNGGTALLEATLNGQEETVRVLLAHRANVNARYLYGGSALMLASDNNHLNICSALICSMADVNAQDEDSYTALIRASFNGHCEVVSLLLKHTADLNIRDVDGSALMNAKEYGEE